MLLNKKIGIVIPLYKTKKHANALLKKLLNIKFIDLVVLVDDECPEQTGKFYKKILKGKKKFKIIFNKNNQGVGGAVFVGFEYLLKKKIDIFVKLDSDLQMRPKDIRKIINPLLYKNADYSKGNRLSKKENFKAMPFIRKIGNFSLSLINKFSTGYWSVSDPTNGFIAIKALNFKQLNKNDISKRFFFESDMLFQNYLNKFVVVDVDIKAIYELENSNLSILKCLFEFSIKNLKNFTLRVSKFYGKKILFNFILFLYGLILLLKLNFFIKLIISIFLIYFFYLIDKENEPKKFNT